MVPCRIRFTTGLLAGIEIPQDLPPEAAAVGKQVRSCVGSGDYVVVAVNEAAAVQRLLKDVLTRRGA